MAKWNNKKRLKKLKVSHEGNVLTFSDGKEKAEVYVKNGQIEKVVHYAQKNKSGKKSVLKADSAQHVVVGENHWQRDVYHYLRPGGPAKQLRLGLTVHKGEGTMSSLPHHFELHPEPDFEEVFYYMIKGGRARGIQVAEGMWHDGEPVDEVWPIEDNSFSTIPIGYHPVIAEPGAKVSYVWAYLAKYPRWEKV